MEVLLSSVRTIFGLHADWFIQAMADSVISTPRLHTALVSRCQVSSSCLDIYEQSIYSLVHAVF